MTAGAAPPRLEIVAGRADDMRAELVLIVTLPDARGAGPVVTGTLTGPWRGRESTLPTTVTLAPMAATLPPNAAAVRGVFTEPAYWSPALPNLYRLRLRVETADREPAVIDRLVGLRRLGVRGRSLWLEGRRWVPRGVAGTGDAFDPATLRRLAAAVELVEPAADTCGAADGAGVAIVARLAVDADRVAAAARVAAWAMHPSVVLLVLPRRLPPGEAAAIAAAVRPVRGTTPLAVEVDGTLPPPAAGGIVGAGDGAGGPDCLVVDLPEEGLPHEAWRAWPGTLPLVARRAAAVDGSPDAAGLRRECDRLQAALAAWGVAEGAVVPPWDWAGYLAVRQPREGAVSRRSPPA